MDVLIIILLAGLLLFNIIFYIPYLLKKQEEKFSLHFKEIQIRLNRLEKSIESNKEVDKIQSDA